MSILSDLEWSWDKPTESGLYLICFGDVETPNNVGLFNVYIEDKGSIYSAKDGFVSKYTHTDLDSLSKSYKYCKIG